MRALSIRQPHAEAIMRGVKKIEYRSRSTRIRERVYIYAALGRFSSEVESKMMADYKIKDKTCDDLPRGVLIGTVELFDCTGDDGEYKWHVRKPERAKKLLKPTGRPQPAWFNPFRLDDYMEPTRLQLFKVRLTALKRTLDKTAHGQKGGLVTKPMAEQFNALLSEIGTAFPNIKDALPKRLEATAMYGLDFGVVDASYLDLEVFVEQVLGMLELLESA